MLEALLSADIWLFRLVNHSIASPLLDQVMLFLTNRDLWSAVGVLALVFAIYRKSKKLILYCVVLVMAISITDFVTYRVLKQSIARPRPCYSIEDVRLVPPRCGSDYGFPSNHASNGMTAAVVTGLFFRRRKVWAAGLALVAIVGFTRVYLGVHYPLDIIAGYIFGALVGWFVYFIYLKIKMRNAGDI